jgi:hypothetical protein
MKPRSRKAASRDSSPDRGPSASRSRPMTGMWAGYISACLALLTACAVGRHHTPDSRLEENFVQHESEFDTLLTDVTADEKLEMIGIHELRYGGAPVSSTGDLADSERLGLTKERFAHYQRLLRKLGLIQVTKGEGGVEFRVDQGSIFNGDSYKGYEYRATPPEHQKVSLDEYRIAEADRGRFGGYSVCKRIKVHWYLYLFVNGPVSTSKL